MQFALPLWSVPQQMKRRTSLLIGLGLVLVGLLAGILGTLLFSEAAQPAPQFVRRVEFSGSPLPGSSARPPMAGSGTTDSSRTALSHASPQERGPTGQLNGLFRQVAGQVRPSVVYIQVESGQQVLPDDGLHDFDDDGGNRRRFFGPRRSVGSGVIISPDGYIVTNNHVVEGAESIEVNLADKRRFEAEIVGTDPSTDLAVLKAKGTANLPALPMGNSDAVDVGEWVLAVGNPFRLTSTVTAGIVSALGRQVGIINDRFGIENFIQTDAAINPGNSGGALVNMEGELVGIATAIASEGGSYEGYGFAVPSNLVQRVARDLIEHGEVERGFLGVSITDVTAPMARRLGLDEVSGAYISDVKSGGAADQAGLQSGDVVQSVGDRRVAAANELQSAVARRRPGDTVQVQVWREGTRRTLSVKLLGRDAPVYRDWMSALGGDDGPAPRPTPPGGDQEAPPQKENAPPQVFELEGWGLGLRALTQKERDAFERQRGVFLAYVADDGTASRGSVPRGVVVTAIGGHAVHSVEDALRALKEAAARNEPTLLRVKRRDGTAAFYEVEPPR